MIPILLAAGRLDPTAFGQPVAVEVGARRRSPRKGFRNNGWRRAIYVLQRRTTPMTMLEVFDLPPMSPNCIERANSTVSTQALQMMNCRDDRERARFLAGRLMDEFPGATREADRRALPARADAPACAGETRQGARRHR